MKQGDFLIVVDMQNDFITGALGTKEAQKIVPKVVDKVNYYIAHGGRVLFTKDTHYEHYMRTQEGANLPVPHCIKDTDGWQICPELIGISMKYPILIKNTFGSQALFNLFQYNHDGISSNFELVGLCTGICVISNALLLKTALPESVITVDANCCACVTPETHKTALAAMKLCQINVIGE